MRTKSATELLLPRVYEDIWYRGQAYAERSKVKVTKEDKHEIRALVSGTTDYFVGLAFSGSGLARRCTCPYMKAAAKTVACKHLVALAIIWDRKRDLVLPTREEIESETITPPFITYKDIDDAYTDPLHADLETLRLMASESGVWAKAHARLPLGPRIVRDIKTPLTTVEVRVAIKELSRWPGHPAYDHSFCSGEMIAALCELMRVVGRRAPVTPPFVAAEILRDLQKAHYKMIGEQVDDSDGLYVFSEHHLEALHGLLKKARVSVDDQAEFDAKLWEYEVHRDDY